LKRSPRRFVGGCCCSRGGGDKRFENHAGRSTPAAARKNRGTPQGSGEMHLQKYNFVQNGGYEKGSLTKLKGESGSRA